MFKFTPLVSALPRMGSLILFLICLSSNGCDMHSKGDEKLTFDEYINNAQKYMYEGKVEKAISAYKKALTIRPSDPETHYVLGEIYYREWGESLETSQRKQLFDLFTHTSKSQPKDNTRELEKFGLKTEYEKLAINEFRAAVKYDPTIWKARLFIAGDYMKRKEYLQAINEYKKTIELNPEYIPVHGSLGRAYMKAGLMDLAIESLHRATQLDPDNDYDFYSLGVAYRNKNNGDKVNEILRKLKSKRSVYYDELRLGLFGGEDP